jgi:choice-of-anchor B domain-containing protein
MCIRDSFVQNDELDEQRGNTNGLTRTHLWDVSNLSNPVYKGFWDNTTFAVDHNLYVVGDLVYQANYTTGLRILRIGDLSGSDSSKWFKEVAYFDTYAPNDNPTFNGAWNVYPFFDSGNVVVSDINGGLFVLRPDMKGIYSDMPRTGWLPMGPILNAVPEPSSALFLVGAGLLTFTRRRRT